MLLLDHRSKPESVTTQTRRQERSFYAGFGLLVFLFLVTAQLARLFAPEFAAAILAFLSVLAVTLIRPAFGLGMAITLTVVGDAGAMAWWPASKNLSSGESVLYVADALTIKPLELVLVGVLGVWLISRRLTPGSPPIVWGPLAWPMVIFTGSLFTGLFWGLARGGDFRIAVWEITTLFYIPMVYLAAINLLTTKQHYHRLFLGILAAITIESIHGLIRLPEIRRVIAEDQSPIEHTAVLHMNLLFLMLVATLWFGTRVVGKRLMLILMFAPTIILYLDAQRRAGIVAMIAGGIALTVVLFTQNRLLFWRIIPAMLVFTALYTGALWNNESAVGFPAQAVKTVIAPDSSNDKDSRSDLYREIENFNLNATIRSNPALGIGFGQPFHQPIPLPDISFFEFADYIPHNSVLWVWVKLGFGGFVAFLYLFAVGTASGVRSAARLKNPDDASLVAVMTAYLPMCLILAFVEIAYDATTTVLLGVSLALATTADRVFDSGDMIELEPEGEPSPAERPPTPEPV